MAVKRRRARGRNPSQEALEDRFELLAGTLDELEGDIESEQREIQELKEAAREFASERREVEKQLKEILVEENRTLRELKTSEAKVVRLRKKKAVLEPQFKAVQAELRRLGSAHVD